MRKPILCRPRLDEHTTGVKKGHVGELYEGQYMLSSFFTKNTLAVKRTPTKVAAG